MKKNSHTNSTVRKTAITGLVSNVVLSGIKFSLGIIGSSQAVIADAVHSLSDVSTDFAIIFGERFWSKPPDHSHPYGHQRIETMISVFIAMILAGSALVFGYNAFTNLNEHTVTHPGWTAFAGAVISIIAKEILFRWTLKKSDENKSKALKANAWHHRSDALSSIPVGIAVLISVVNPELSYIDHIGALAISVFILYAAFKILRDSLMELTGGGASRKRIQRMKSVICAIEGVRSLHALRTRRMGGGWFVDFHLQVNGDMTVRQGHEITAAAEEKLLNECPGLTDVVVHLEPFEEENAADTSSKGTTDTSEK